MKAAQLGIPMEDLPAVLAGPQEKKADITPKLSAYPLDAAKLVLFTSAMLGAPIGIAAHLVGRAIDKRRVAELGLEKRRDFYNNATEDLVRGLA